MTSKNLEFKECYLKNKNEKNEIKDNIQSPILKNHKRDSHATFTSTTVKSQDKLKNQHSFSECSSCTSSNLRCKYDKLKIVFEVEKDVIKIQSKVREFLSKLKFKKIKKKEMNMSQIKNSKLEEIVSQESKNQYDQENSENKMNSKAIKNKKLFNIFEEKITLDSPKSNMDKLNFSKSIPSEMESDLSESNLSEVTYNSFHTVSFSDESNCSLNIVY
jgi:hypothetical protein